jgi:2-polyprenyl-3-methyl-5-hydroxy-6-metoxy-1,4-benzoquinol methylase
MTLATQWGAGEVIVVRYANDAAERYARKARFAAELGAPVVDLVAPRAGERILDLGCGDGVLTAKLASMGCHVIGIDVSGPQIGAARKLKLEVRVTNGEALDFDSEFDAVFSNAALYWMSNPAKDRRSASCTQAARTFCRRIRRPRLRSQDQEGVSRSPQSPRH